MGASGPLALWGRSHERQELDSALGSVLGGQSAVLVVRGEAGIGKTALLEYAVGHAVDFRVVRVAGVESELELPFAALHQLCAPLLTDLDSLPEPQARALKVAFGMAAGNAPDRFLVGLAVLGLLAEAASPRPLLCLVDDANWIDAASRQILGVVGRRLQAESVLLVLAVREAVDERLFPGLPELTVQGLEDGDAQALLTAAAAGPLDPRVMARLIAETEGNPLALLEVVKDTSEAELAGGFVTTPRTLSGPLEDHYLGMVRAMPEPTQRLMLLAAADPTGDATLLWRAAQRLGLGHQTMQEARAQQLLDIGPTVRFRHPLVRSAAYAAGSAQDRRSVHQALADVTDPDRDPDRRVWHLSVATLGPDEDIASALEQVADRAQARAGLSAASAFLRRAAELTLDSGRRADRALAAAHASLHAGTFDAALGLLAEADADAVDDLQRARVEQLRAEVTRAASSGRQAPLLLAEAARRLEPFDVGLARETYLDAWGAALVAGHLAAPGGGLVEVSAAARAAPRAAMTDQGPRPADLLLEGLTTVILDGQGAATATLRQAVSTFLHDRASADEWLHWGVLAANAALALWDFDTWDGVSVRLVTLARQSGALASLAAALNIHRGVAVWAGDLERATAIGVEERVVKEVTGTQRSSYGDLLLVAYQGAPERASSLIAASIQEATARGEGLGMQIGDRATAILNIGLGHYAEALTAARRAAEGNLGPFTAQALPDLVEAAARCGETRAAAEALNRLQAATAVDGSEWAAGLQVRSLALLAEGRAADRSYAEAVERLGTTRLRLELARTRLLYGEWLRREGRRVDAREQLRPAHETFALVGAEAFADRARRELLATGEKVRKRQVDTANRLTAQEEHIARLARDGHTNPEIAAELFISARTVEWHLRNVFTKLGVTNRRGLKEALPDRRQSLLVAQPG